jgi:hypothetical protein
MTVRETIPTLAKAYPDAYADEPGHDDEKGYESAPPGAVATIRTGNRR